MSIVRSKKLTQAAKDNSCVNCNVADGTVVSAHLTGLRAMAFGKGRGIKPSDLCCADLCASCHNKFDTYQVSEIEAGTDTQFIRSIDQSEQFLYLILKTIHRRVEEGLIKLPGDK